MRPTLHRLPLLSLCLTLTAGVSLGQSHSADFDAQSEGTLGTVYIEDGIVFSDLDRYLGSPNETFVAEDGSGSLAGLSGFTSPNTLGFGGYSPGPSAAYSRCGTFKITPPGIFDSGQLALYVAGGSSAGNLVTLEARLAGALVASDSIVIPSTFGPHEFILSVTGSNFDTLHMVGTGSGNSGSFFALVDTVIVGVSAVGTGYCFGDGTSGICPCGNSSAGDEGCANSTSSGTILSAAGSVSVAADDLLFQASQLPPNKPALLFAGDAAMPGIPFGDGVLCVGGVIQRLDVFFSDGAGDASWGPNIASGQSWGAGTMRNFQVWYRDPAGPCSSGFNVSNGVQLTFGP